MQTSFFRNKVQRQINYNGQTFIFNKISRDKYHQANISTPVEITIKGLFHQTISYVNINSSEAGRMVRKPSPMIIALYEDCQNINTDDIVFIGDNKYKVIDKTDINNLNVACDISLELIV